MTLAPDIAEQRWQVTLEKEREAVSAFCRLYPHLRWVETDKTSLARMDGLLYTEAAGERVLKAVVEVKCRAMTLDDLSTRFGWETLINAAKMADGIKAAALLRVPFVLFVHLVPDRLLLVHKLANADGTPAAAIRYEKTTAKASLNGGLTYQLRAFVDMQPAQKYRI